MFHFSLDFSLSYARITENLRRGSEVDLVMRWFGLVFICVGIVALLMSLGVQARMNHPPYVGGTIVVPVERIRFSLVPGLADDANGIAAEFCRSTRTFHYHNAILTTGDVGPPWLDDLGPPGTCGSTLGKLQGFWPSRQLSPLQNTLTPRNSHVSTD